MDELMDRKMNEWLDEWTFKQTYKWINGWINFIQDLHHGMQQVWQPHQAWRNDQKGQTTGLHHFGHNEDIKIKRIILNRK